MIGLAESRLRGGSGTPPAAPITLTTTKQIGFTVRFYCSTYNQITINWGDGNSQLVANSTAIVYNYAEAGEHTVTITGDESKITRFYCQNMEVTSIAFANDCNLSNCGYLYLDRNPYYELILPSSFTSCQFFIINSCPNLTTLDVSNLTSVGNTFRVHSTGLTSLTTYFPSCNNFEVQSSPNLISVNANNLTSVTYFYAYSCHNLTTLNVSSLTNATYFYAYSCHNLTTLNVNSLTSATQFYAYLCPNLTTLDISNLTYVSVFSIYGIGLTTLKTYFSSCFTFSAYSCPNLTSLDVSSLTSVGNYFYAHSCPNLTTLNISNLTNVLNIHLYITALTTISLSQITNINTFRIEKCGLTESQVDAIIAQCLSIAANDSSCTFEIDNGVTGGVNNAAPSAAGLADVATLRSIGWTVRHA